MSRGALWGLAGVLALTGVVLLTVRELPAARWHGTRLDPPKPPAGFTLQSADGPVGLDDLKGHVVAMYFGYTFCPDHCPLTLSNLAAAVRLLGRDADAVRVVMVSVDPERDTPEKTTRYARAFHPGFIGLTGSPEQIAEVARSYGIFYRKRPVESGAKYLIDHTVSILVLDRRGALSLIWPSGIEPDEIALDLRRLVRLR